MVDAVVSREEGAIGSAGPFTKTLLHAVQPVMRELLTHPFTVQLAEGSLPSRCFAHYLSQDILYLHDDTAALELLATRAPSAAERIFFNALAVDGVEIERTLHAEFLHHFQVHPAVRKSYVVDQYTTFLLHHARNEPYAVAAAALLSCFWVYGLVGNHIVATAAHGNRYQKWIDTYHGAEYTAYTQRFIEIIEELGGRQPKSEQEKMTSAFFQATSYELQFFAESMQT